MIITPLCMWKSPIHQIQNVTWKYNFDTESINTRMKSPPQKKTTTIHYWLWNAQTDLGVFQKVALVIQM